MNCSLLPTQYQEIMTDDGSATLFDTQFKEAMHSSAGAILETELVYINGCEIKERPISKKRVSVLEVGLGFGHALSLLLKMNAPIDYFAFEINKELCEFTLNRLSIPFKKEGNDYLANLGQMKIRVLCGDARVEVSKLFGKKFMAIFQDPYSPDKCPTLWSVEWFIDLFKLSDEETILTTYSASSRVRKAMLLAGFSISEFQGHGKKRGSTKAFIGAESERSILDRLSRSPVLPIRDSDL